MNTAAGLAVLCMREIQFLCDVSQSGGEAQWRLSGGSVAAQWRVNTCVARADNLSVHSDVTVSRCHETVTR